MTTNVNLGFVAAAGGTVNAITATYSPAPSALVDKMLVWFRATGANTSTTPTFSPNGLTARTIVKQGGQPLVAGDIPAAGAIMEMVYDASNTRWELVNPTFASNISGWTDDGVNVRLTTITDSVGIGTATPANKLQVVGGVTANSTSDQDVWRIGYDNGNDISKIDVDAGTVTLSAATATTGASMIVENNGRLTINTVGAAPRITGSGFQSFDDNSAATSGGLGAGDLYQTTGNGAAPLNVAGILMVTQ